MEWTDDLSVNVREIDAQHKQLAAMVNALHEAWLANQGQEVLRAIVAELLQYSGVHFATEEQYMQRFGTSGYGDHKREHEEFAAKAADLDARLAEGRLELTDEILDFLRDWLRWHILGTDKKYTLGFNEHGLR